MMDNPILYNIDKNICINNPKSCVKPTTCTTFHNSYKMYNYTDFNPSEHSEEDSLYKSVVVDEHTQQIYCFSPPKSVPLQTFFTNKSSDASTSFSASSPNAAVLRTFASGSNFILNSDT